MEVIDKVYALLEAYRDGKLGGEKMPEDENPHLKKNAKENYHYFTLPMALNYQRNSYVLWECANRSYFDEKTRSIFDTRSVVKMSNEELKNKLTMHKVALQPNKQPLIWQTICRTIEDEFQGDIRELFQRNHFSVARIKEYIAQNKGKFPYLGGSKICNYWLYVMEKYTDAEFTDRECISVAPDTHVIQASVKLGVVTLQESRCANIQEIVAERWREILQDTDLVPIDIHTPMWLWSRGKFRIEI